MFASLASVLSPAPAARPTVRQTGRAGGDAGRSTARKLAGISRDAGRKDVPGPSPAARVAADTERAIADFERAKPTGRVGARGSRSDVVDVEVDMRGPPFSSPEHGWQRRDGTDDDEGFATPATEVFTAQLGGTDVMDDVLHTMSEEERSAWEALNNNYAAAAE